MVSGINLVDLEELFGIIYLINVRNKRGLLQISPKICYILN